MDYICTNCGTDSNCHLKVDNMEKEDINKMIKCIYKADFKLKE